MTIEGDTTNSLIISLLLKDVIKLRLKSGNVEKINGNFAILPEE